MIRTMKKRKPSRKRTKRHNNIKRNTKRSIKRRHNKRRKTKGGMLKMFGRRNRETNVSPSLSSSTSEPTTPTSSASDESGQIDWSELERNPRRMPGQTRTNRNCSRNLSAVTKIKPCVENEEELIKNKGKSCKEIMEICINKEYGENLPRYMLSPNKRDIMVPAIRDTRRGPMIERTNGKVTLYPLDHYVWREDGALTPVIHPETIPGDNEYNTLKDEMLHGNVHQARR